MPSNDLEKEEHEKELIKEFDNFVSKMTDEEKLHFVRFVDKYFLDEANLRDEEQLECTKEAAMELIRFIRVLENPLYDTTSISVDIEVAVGQFLGCGPWFSDDEEKKKPFDDFTVIDFSEAEDKLKEQMNPDNEYFIEMFYAAGYLMQNKDKFKSLIPSNMDENCTDEEHQSDQELLLEQLDMAARSYFWEFVHELEMYPFYVMDLRVGGQEASNDVDESKKRQKLDNELN